VIDVTIPVIDVDSVEITVVVEVAPSTPPKDANRSIEARGFVPADVVLGPMKVWLKLTGEPTIHPLLGSVM